MSLNLKFVIQHLLCGASLFIAAFVCCVVIFGAAPDRDWIVMIFTAPLSAAIIGVSAWAALTSLGKSVKMWKGIMVGILAGSVSHFFAWYLSIIFLYLQKSVMTSLGEPTVGPVEGIWASLLMSFFSLAVLGWLTIPIGAVVGALVAAVSQRFLAHRLA